MPAPARLTPPAGLAHPSRARPPRAWLLSASLAHLFHVFCFPRTRLPPAPRTPSRKEQANERGSVQPLAQAGNPASKVSIDGMPASMRLAHPHGPAPGPLRLASRAWTPRSSRTLDSYPQTLRIFLARLDPAHVTPMPTSTRSTLPTSLAHLPTCLGPAHVASRTRPRAQLLARFTPRKREGASAENRGPWEREAFLGGGPGCPGPLGEGGDGRWEPGLTRAPKEREAILGGAWYPIACQCDSLWPFFVALRSSYWLTPDCWHALYGPCLSMSTTTN